MKNLFFILLLFTISVNSQVFPGAKGWGSNWVFPKETADWYNVENLNDSGPGSYRYGVENAPLTGRIITFYGTSGYIEPLTRIESTSPNVYVAGQTSPNGIVIRRVATTDTPSMLIDGDNTIIRDMIFAYDYFGGSRTNGDCLQLGGGTSNVILDRLELYFGTDETLQLYASTSDFTFQNGTIGYALYDNNIGMEGKGVIVAALANRTSWYNVFMPHNMQRNILFGGDSSPGPNHEVHNFYSYGAYAFGMVLSNYNTEINLTNYLDEPSLQDIDNRYSILISGTSPSLYVNNTFNEYRTLDSQDEWASVGDHTAPFSTQKSTSQQSLIPFNYNFQNEQELTKQQIKNTVLTYSKSSNNWFDIRDKAVNDAINGTGTLISNISDLGGWPADPPMGADINDDDSDGIPNEEESNYSTLFDYVNSLLDNTQSNTSNNKIYLNNNDLTAFPGAEGWGKNTTGGRGGKIVHVTNLNESGPGSLLEAMHDTEPRVVVFDVSGKINWSSEHFIPNDASNVSIFFQTAPNPGITIEGHTFGIRASEVILRFPRIRVNDDDGNGNEINGNIDGLRIINGTSNYIMNNVIADHVSVSQGTDENVSFGGSAVGATGGKLRRVTLQNSMITDAFGQYQYAMLIGQNLDSISVIRNGFMNVGNRVPEMTYATPALGIEFVNNIIYNYNIGPTLGYGPITFDSYNNVFKGDEDFPPSYTNHRWQLNTYENPDGQPDEGTIHQSGNIQIGYSTYGMMNQSWADYNEPQRNAASSYIPLETNSVVDSLLYDLGAVKIFDDPIDSARIDEFINSTGQRDYPSVAAAGGVPNVPNNTHPSNYDSDNDGLSDEWENAQGFNVNHDDRPYEFILPNGVIVNQGNIDNYQNIGYTQMDAFAAYLAGDWDKYNVSPNIDVNDNNVNGIQRRRIINKVN